MCTGNCKGDCKGCSGASADGVFDSTEGQAKIATLINAYVFDSKGEIAAIQDAYVKTRVFFDDKNLDPTEENIKANLAELKLAINDPNYLLDKTKESSTRPGWELFAIIAGFSLIVWWCFKSSGASVIKI